MAAITHGAGILIHEPHNPVSETISDLAAGPHAWIQDLGIILLGLGLAAVAVGLRLWRRGGRAWRLATVFMVLLAADLMVIAGHNEYGDLDSGKFVIHSYAVYALGLLVLLAALLLAPGLGRTAEAGRRWHHASIAFGTVWLLLAPLFFVVPTAWDGLYERGIAALLIGWIGALSWLLVRRVAVVSRRDAPWRNAG